MDVGRLGFLQSTLVEVDAKIRQLLTTWDAASMLTYEQGRLVLQVRQTEVYRIADGKGYKTAEAFLSKRLDRKPGTLRRRARMAEVFSEDEFRGLVADKIKPSVIADIAQLSSEIRPHVVKVAHEVQCNHGVRAALSDWRKRTKQAARLDDPAQWLMKAALDKINARRRAKLEAAERRKVGKGEDRRETDRGDAEARVQEAEKRAQEATEKASAAEAQVSAAEERVTEQRDELVRLRVAYEELQARIQTSDEAAAQAPGGDPSVELAKLRGQVQELQRQLAHSEQVHEAEQRRVQELTRYLAPAAHHHD